MRGKSYLVNEVDDILRGFDVVGGNVLVHESDANAICVKYTQVIGHTD